MIDDVGDDHVHNERADDSNAVESDDDDDGDYDDDADDDCANCYANDVDFAFDYDDVGGDDDAESDDDAENDDDDVAVHRSFHLNNDLDDYRS